MAVVGNDCLVVDWINGKICDALPFHPSIGTSTSMPVVDAALVYDCPFTHMTYIVIARNVMHLKTLKHNLIAPFIMREAGVIVDDKPKIHSWDVDHTNHSQFFPDINVQIPLKLNGIFSYFEIWALTCNEIEHCDTTFITPDAIEWDPYSDHFALNEDEVGRAISLSKIGETEQEIMRTTNQTTLKVLLLMI